MFRWFRCYNSFCRRWSRPWHHQGGVCWFNRRCYELHEPCSAPSCFGSAVHLFVHFCTRKKQRRSFPYSHSFFSKFFMDCITCSLCPLDCWKPGLNVCLNSYSFTSQTPHSQTLVPETMSSGIQKWILRQTE